MRRISAIFLFPPIAIARLGGATTPVDAFEWIDDEATHGANQTAIRPAVTLRVLPDGSISPFLPSVIFFRDGAGGLIRPTAPFFEVWARFDDSKEPEPLTATQLEASGGSLDRVTFRLSAANLKAARRTKDAACGFGAEIELAANDHTPKALLAVSPHVAGSESLVLPPRPIPLGKVQAIRPFPGTTLRIDRDVLRLRFTPAAGEVYGPPAAAFAIDPDAPRGSLRQFEIVPEGNRILNPAASWCHFRPTDDLEQPEPADTFDGVEDTPDGIGGQSWGVVDDTCDIVIHVTIEIGPDLFTAMARATVGPPDFAPDRRPFVSLADDLADRELPPLSAQQIKEPITVDEVADLLRRVFETVSLTNLDALRLQMLGRQNPAAPDPVPHTDLSSMTPADRPLADQVAEVIGTGPGPRLPFTAVAHDVHGERADVDSLIELFRTQPERVRHLLRPPYARMADLPEQAVTPPATDPLGPYGVAVLTPVERDIRVPRSQFHDMRMPPYMRDDDATPLSLTWRQYREVMALIDHLAALDDAHFSALSPARRHVAQVVDRRRKAAAERSQSS